MIKLIASDIDGTLLHPPTWQFSKELPALFEALLQKDIHIVIASGRQYFNMRALFMPFDERLSYICENGSLIIHQGKVLKCIHMDDELVKRILEDVHHQDDFEVMVSTEEGTYIEDHNQDFIHLMTNEIGNQTLIVPDARAITSPVMKIAVLYYGKSEDRLHHYLAHLQDQFGNEIKVVTSGHQWIDFIAPGGNKGAALKTLLDELGIDPKEAMAFGDQYNDIEMLSLVGEGYAMKNGPEGVKAYAKHVTTSVEEVLELLIENKLPHTS